MSLDQLDDVAGEQLRSFRCHAVHQLELHRRHQTCFVVEQITVAASDEGLVRAEEVDELPGAQPVE